MADKDYEAARNELIPEAMRYADSVMGERPTWASGVWNRAYLGMMNTLAVKAGLVRAAQ